LKKASSILAYGEIVSSNEIRGEGHLYGRDILMERVAKTKKRRFIK
jgi:hypothetical protein